MGVPQIVLDVKVKLALVAGCLALMSTGVLNTQAVRTSPQSSEVAFSPGGVPPKVFSPLVPYEPPAPEVAGPVADFLFIRNTTYVPRASAARVAAPGDVQAVSPITAKKEAPRPDEPEPPSSAAVPISSKNVQFISNVPLPGQSFAGTAGGRFQKRDDGKVLFFATGPTGLTVVDATNPRVPLVIGEMILPHYENEDVDLWENTLLISADGSFGSALFIIDISIPHAPFLRSTYKFQPEPGKWTSRGGPGHIANCVDRCRYAYVTGARTGWVAIVELGDPSSLFSSPRLVGAFHPPAGDPNAVFKGGDVHDVNVDPSGLVWLTGSGGVSAYGVGGAWPGSPTEPVHVASNNTPELNRFILHNSLRPNAGPTLLVTEEDYQQNEGDCAEDGRFQTYSFDGSTVTPLDSWNLPEKLGMYTNGSGPLAYACSAHWFDHRYDGLVAIGWYMQGVRLLDVSDPRDIKQRGWFNVPNTMASAAYFHPSDTKVVYVADFSRGIDVIEVCPDVCPLGGAVPMPLFSSSSAALKPSEAWGYACPIMAKV